MPRAKLGMKLIESPKKRRASYKNRRAGLVNKAEQLATLCGIDVLLVCFDPDDDAAAAVTTWPADRDAALRLVRRYRDTPPDKIKHDLSAATYYQVELAKEQRKLLKAERRGPPTLAPDDARLAGLSADEAYAMLQSLDDALLKTQRRIVALGGRVVHDDDDDVDRLDVLLRPSSEVVAHVENRTRVENEPTHSLSAATCRVSQSMNYEVTWV